MAWSCDCSIWYDSCHVSHGRQLVERLDKFLGFLCRSVIEDESKRSWLWASRWLQESQENCELSFTVINDFFNRVCHLKELLGLVRNKDQRATSKYVSVFA